jgi:Putative Ig domain
MERAHPMKSKPARFGGHRLRIYGAPITQMKVHVPYPGFNVVARGGNPPYQYSVASSTSEIFWEGQATNQIIWQDSSGNIIIWEADAIYTLPPGLTLNPFTGFVTGTPSTVGNYPVKIQVTDSKGQTAITGIIVFEVLA